MEKLVLKGRARFLQALFSARKWQRFWSKNWVLKVISLVLATLLWYFVGGEDVVDKNVMVPIEIINLPRDLVISNQFKKDIEVTVSGPRSVIQEMSNKAVTRQLDLSKATPGTNVIENDNSSIPVPRGITVLRIQPSSIILTLDKLIQKQFPVTPVTTGDVAAGFELVRMVMNPDVITITGPQTVLAQAEALMTEVIDIRNMKESKQVQVPLDLDPSFVDLIGQTSVTADITVKPKMVEKKVSRVEVDASVDGQPREVAPKTVDVIVKVPVLLLRDQKDLKKLFSVTAASNGGNGGFLKVEVVPNKVNSLPLEVVSVIPSAVKLVQKPGDTPAGEPAAENPENEAAQKEENGKPANKKEDAGAAQESEQRTIMEEETSGRNASEVKILPVKKKRVIKAER